MSQPNFPKIDPPLTRDDVINQVISSIAMEELGLSHIINAEGEKIQYALGTLEGSPGLASPATMDELLELNKSVCDTLDSVTQNQMFLKYKLQAALSAPTTPDPRPTNGLNAFAGIYNNVDTSYDGTRNVPIIVKLPLATSSRNVSFVTPNSITLLEAGTYYLTYEMLASFNVPANLIVAVRSNGTNIKMTENRISVGAIAPVYYSGTAILDFPKGAVIDMAVISDVNITISFDAASIPGINVFKLN